MLLSESKKAIFSNVVIMDDIVWFRSDSRGWGYVPISSKR